MAIYLCILSIIILILYLSPSSQFTLAISDQHWTRATNIAQIIIAFFAILAFSYTAIANKRSEKLFTAANTPLIDVTPVGVAQAPNAQGIYFTTTILNIANYSGFKAFDIGIDLKYGKNAWITEWIKADKEKNDKNPGERIIDGKPYPSAPQMFITELEPGDSKSEEIKSAQVTITGMFDLEKDVCSQGARGLPVLVRVAWKNDKGHVFDEVHRYRLIGTPITYPSQFGYSFTFIPEGITSKKGSKLI